MSSTKIVKDLYVSGLKTDRLSLNAPATVIGDLAVNGNAVLNSEFFRQFNELILPTQTAYTATPTELINGMIYRQTGSPALALALPTPAEMVEAFPNDALRKYATLVIVNASTTATVTITPQTGWTISDNTIPPDTSALFDVFITNDVSGSEAVEMLLVSNSLVT